MERLGEKTAQLKSQLQAWRFATYAHAIGAARGDSMRAMALHKQLERRAPDAARVFKAAVAAGSTASAAWGSALSTWDAAASEFVEMTNSLSILGALQARSVRIPFNTRVLVATTPTTAAFVAPGAPIPVGAQSLTDTVQLGMFKCAVLRMFTRELLEISTPAAIQNVRDGMALSTYRGIDTALLDPDSAGVAEETPASLTSGVAPLGLFGSTAALALASFSTLLQAQVTAGSDLKRVAIFMHPSTLLALSLLRGTDGSITFPTITALGGEISGVPIFATASAQRSGSPPEKLVVCADCSRIALADDGGLEVSAANFTSLQPDSAPTNHTDGTGSTMVSMFQTHSVAMKLVRHINWTKASSTAVCWMTSNY